MVRWEAEHNGLLRSVAPVAAGGIERARPAESVAITARFIDLLNPSAADVARATDSCAQNAPVARAGAAQAKPGHATKGATPALDPSSLAARQLSQRGPVRATVEQAVERSRRQDTPASQAQDRARRSGDSQGAPDEALASKEPIASGERGDGRTAKGNGFEMPPIVDTAGKDSPTSAGPADDEGSSDPKAQNSTETRVNNGGEPAQDSEARGQVSPSPAGEPAGAEGASLPVAAAAMLAAGAATTSSGVASPSPAGSAAVEGVRVASVKPLAKPQGPADPRQPATPEEQAQLAAPGVRGQAMRGVFSMLRGVSAGTTSGWMKLNPEALGEMKVTLAVQEGRVNASFAVSTDEAHAALKDSITDLRDALRSRGLTLEAVEIHRVPGTAAAGVEVGNRPGHEPPQDFGGLAGDSRSGAGEQGGSPQPRGQDAGEAGRGMDGWMAGAEAPEEVIQSILSTPGWKPGVDLTA